jgi:lipopolysaccharide/colanic/teichoic acid biosynthesis glycosyltransferase
MKVDVFGINRSAVPHPARAATLRERRSLVVAIFTLDALAIGFAVASTDLIRLWLEIYLKIWPLAAERHLIASVLVVPVLLTLFRLEGLYDLDFILAGTREYARVVNAVTYAVFIAVFVSYFAGGEPIVSRLWLLLLWVVSVLVVSTARFALRRVVRQMRQHGHFRTRVIIVGASPLGVAIANQLTMSADEGLDVVGFLDAWVPIGQRIADDIVVIGRPEDLVDGRLVDAADEFILVPQALPSERLDEITRMMVAWGGPTVRTAVSSADLLTNGILVAQRGNIPLVTLRRARIAGVDAFLKRTFDIVGAAAGLVVIGPIALIALVRGAILGRRPLVDRVQIHSATDGFVSVNVLSTRVSSSLLVRGAPALLAVLAGRMSLVGPRPVAGDDRSVAEPSIAVVRPGITGPWRLRGTAATLDDQAIGDLAYVRDYRIWEDIRIVLMTLWRSRSDASPLGRWECGTDVHDPLKLVSRSRKLA